MDFTLPSAPERQRMWEQAFPPRVPLDPGLDLLPLAALPLTGAVIIELGSTYAGLMSNDDEFAARISAAWERAGETVWRLPLHREYAELVKGTYADLNNAPEARKAGTILGAAFLSNFVGDVPWAHLDIAGSAWDLGRPYASKGASGYGVRLLVELARSYSAVAA